MRKRDVAWQLRPGKLCPNTMLFARFPQDRKSTESVSSNLQFNEFATRFGGQKEDQENDLDPERINLQFGV